MPAPLSRLTASDPALRTLSLALGISLCLHGLVLAIQFKLPEALDRARERALDVVLVNSSQRQAPKQAQARAQANLDAGGNSERAVRARSPLPPTREQHPGEDLIAAQQRVAALERQQREILSRPGPARSAPPVAEPQQAPQPALSGRDLATLARAQVRTEAEIARSLEEYNQRPKRKFLGARVAEYRFAQYVEDWRQKVERVGNLNYPQAAKGRLYGNLVLTVAIQRDGDIERIEINRSSGHAVLDEAALRIVRLAAPFAIFPEAIRRDTDIIEITRTWSFTAADQLQAN